MEDVQLGAAPEREGSPLLGSDAGEPAGVENGRHHSKRSGVGQR